MQQNQIKQSITTVPWVPLPPRDRERGTRKDEERRPVDEGEEPVGTSVEGNSSRAQMPATNMESLSNNKLKSPPGRCFTPTT